MKLKIGSVEMEVELPLKLTLSEPLNLEAEEWFEINLKEAGEVSIQTPAKIFARVVKNVRGEVELHPISGGKEIERMIEPRLPRGEIGRKILELLRQKDMTLTELAQSLNRTPPAIWKTLNKMMKQQKLVTKIGNKYHLVGIERNEEIRSLEIPIVEGKK